MAKFKVGDRVRIVCPASSYGLNGKVGTIWDISPRGFWEDHPSKNGSVAYLLDVDGFGRRGPDRYWVGYTSDELRPLINPDETAWQAFRDLHLKPDPALIMAKEPAKEEV